MGCTGMAWKSAWITGTISGSYTIEFSPTFAVAQNFLSKVSSGDVGNASALVLNFRFRDSQGHDHLVDLTPNYGDVSTYTTVTGHDQMVSVTFQFFGTNQFAVATANVFFFS
jgi:hypothetical protein